MSAESPKQSPWTNRVSLGLAVLLVILLGIEIVSLYSISGYRDTIATAGAQITALQNENETLKMKVDVDGQAISALNRQIQTLRSNNQVVAENYVSAGALKNLVANVDALKQEVAGAIEKEKTDNDENHVAIDRMAKYLSTQLYPAVSKLDAEVKRQADLQQSLASIPVGRLIPAGTSEPARESASTTPQVATQPPKVIVIDSTPNSPKPSSTPAPAK